MGHEAVLEDVALSSPGTSVRGWLLCERGVGSGERGFLILIFKNSDNHGEGDLETYYHGS
jgi:hypothetical protein